MSRPLRLALLAVALPIVFGCKTAPVEREPCAVTEGVAFQRDGDVFQVTPVGCRIRWTVVPGPKGTETKAIQVDDSCDTLEMTHRMIAYDAILCRIAEEHGRERISALHGHAFHNWDLWRERMAIASFKSKEYAAFEAKRKKTRAEPNTVYVRVFNQARVARELSELFRSYGLRLELNRVEKVFEAKASELPFAQESAALRASSKRVMYAAGLYEFGITPPR